MDVSRGVASFQELPIGVTSPTRMWTHGTRTTAGCRLAVANGRRPCQWNGPLTVACGTGPSASFASIGAAAGSTAANSCDSSAPVSQGRRGDISFQHGSSTTTTTTTTKSLITPLQNNCLTSTSKTSTNRLPQRRNFNTTAQLATRIFQRRFYSQFRMADVKWPAALVRQTYLEFFEKRGHTIGTMRPILATKQSHPFGLFGSSGRILVNATMNARNMLLTLGLQSLPAPSSLTMTPPCFSPMRA